MLLPQNQEIFSQFFSAFPESRWNSEYFQTKDELRTIFVSVIVDWKKRGYLNAQKARVRTLMDSQHVNGSETLHKSAAQYFFHIF